MGLILEFMNRDFFVFFLVFCWVLTLSQSLLNKYLCIAWLRSPDGSMSLSWTLGINYNTTPSSIFISNYLLQCLLYRISCPIGLSLTLFFLTYQFLMELQGKGKKGLFVLVSASVCALFVYSICLAFICFFPTSITSISLLLLSSPPTNYPDTWKSHMRLKINAAIIYTQSLQMHKGGSVMAEDHHHLE